MTEQQPEDTSSEGHEDRQPEDTSSEGHDSETFPRSYVERLRREAAEYRTRGQADREAVDALRSELWAERVAAAGRLADPSDLPMPADAEAVDSDTVTAAIDALLETKPHLAARRAAGDIGQHSKRGDGGDGAGVSLAALLQRGA